MALPLPPILSPEEAAQCGRTLAPYVFSSQILELPTRVIEAANSADALHSFQELYLGTNPMLTAVAFALALCPFFVLAAEIRNNYSQVDCWWSFLPSIYNLHYYAWAYGNGLPTDRLQTIGVISIRLTYNYWRKGGYSWGAEDYRWAVLRDQINNRFLFFLFDVVFIALTQSLLLCAITAPTYLFTVLAQLPETGAIFDIADLVFSRLLFFYILIETVADEQQWRYQQAKIKYCDTGVIIEGYDKEDLERGFVVSGLWSYSRHPNFAAEQAIWLTLYLWSAYKTETYLNWACVGALGYLALFQGSTWLTEMLSGRKYPEYVEYQARVGRFIPRWSVSAKAQKKAKAQAEKMEEKKNE
uniref:Steroid 5-alpha reductase C-terminal domain-containing protein n=1 Tax=Talaromyces marneffei PM1 TaxID=1077442 RepID=A0A093VW70_TALMA